MIGWTHIIGNGPNDVSRADAMVLVKHAPQGAILTIEPPGRTIPQNRRFHAMLRDVSKAKPEGRQHSPDVWKALFMAACGHEVQFVEGLDGQPFPLGSRSSHLSKAQMGDLMEFMAAWGTERGVQWSDPEYVSQMRATRMEDAA